MIRTIIIAHQRSIVFSHVCLSVQGESHTGSQLRRHPHHTGDPHGLDPLYHTIQESTALFVLLKLTICKPVCKYSGIVKSEYIDMCFVYEIVCHDGNVSVPEPWPCHTHVRRVESQ